MANLFIYTSYPSFLPLSSNLSIYLLYLSIYLYILPLRPQFKRIDSSLRRFRSKGVRLMLNSKCKYDMVIVKLKLSSAGYEVGFFNLRLAYNFFFKPGLWIDMKGVQYPR